MEQFSDPHIDQLYEMLVAERGRNIANGEFSAEERAYLLLNVAARCHSQGKHEKRDRAVGEITRLKPEANLLLSLLDEQPELAHAVMRCCGELGYGEGAYVMKRALDDGGEHEKLCAIEALARLGKTKPIARRLKGLALDSGKVFDHAVAVLRERRSRRAGHELRKLLRHDEPEVRRRSVEALALFRGGETLLEVAKRLDDREFEVRKGAAEALVLLAPSAKKIGMLLANRKAHIRWAAAKILSKIGNAGSARAALPLLLDKYSHVRKAASELVQRFGRPAHECSEEVYDRGRTVHETLAEYRKLKIIRERESLAGKGEREKLEMALSRKEVAQARKDEARVLRAVLPR